MCSKHGLTQTRATFYENIHLHKSSNALHCKYWISLCNIESNIEKKRQH